MSWPEVQELLGRTDIAIMPLGALEQHGPQLPAGTDYLSAVERAKLIAQRTDVLVAPILLPGLSPYHMEFPGTISLSHETLQRVYLEAAQSLVRQGFRRILFLNSHVGNQHLAAYIVDRTNMETAAVALELSTAVAPMQPSRTAGATKFDRHAGVRETSSGLYLLPSLLDMNKADANDVVLPEHLRAILPQVVAGDPVLSQLFLVEALKPMETGCLQRACGARETRANRPSMRDEVRQSHSLMRPLR